MGTLERAATPVRRAPRLGCAIPTAEKASEESCAARSAGGAPDRSQGPRPRCRLNAARMAMKTLLSRRIGLLGPSLLALSVGCVVADVLPSPARRPSTRCSSCIPTSTSRAAERTEGPCVRCAARTARKGSLALAQPRLGRRSFPEHLVGIRRLPDPEICRQDRPGERARHHVGEP